MNNKSYHFHNLLISQFLGFFAGVFSKPKKLVAPRAIGNYAYRKVLHHEKGHDTMVVIYQDNYGKKAVAKIWQGKYKNYSYYSLQNEYLLYQSLNSVIARTKSILPTGLKNIHIPRLINYQEKSDQTILMIEWVEGIVGTQLTDKELLDSYLKVNQYLDFLSDHLSKSELRHLSTRSASHYFLVYFFTFLTSVAKYPNSFTNLLRGLILVLKNVSHFLYHSKLTLVHRDLNFENILKSKNKVYLIDFQFTLLTYKAFEFVSTLRYCYDKNHLTGEIENLMFEHYGSDVSVQKLYTPLRVMHATHGLIASDFSPKIITSIKRYLRDTL